MRTLLHADLRALGNRVGRPDGRGWLARLAVHMGCLAAISLVASRLAILDGPLRPLLDPPLNVARFTRLVELVLVPGFLAVVYVGWNQSKVQLFESASAELLLVAPIPRRWPVSRAFLRLATSATLLGTALTLPAFLLLSSGAGLAPWVLVAVPLTVLLGAAPVIAAIVTVQVALWSLGPPALARRAIAIGALSVNIACILALGLGLLGGATVGGLLLDWARADRGLLVTVREPAKLLASSWIATPTLAQWLVNAALLATAPALLWLAGLGYARAYQRSQAAPQRPAGARREASFAWPERPLASVLKRELVVHGRATGKPLAYTLVALFAVLLASTGFFSRETTLPSPGGAVERGVFQLLAFWFVVLLFTSAFTLPTFRTEGASRVELLVLSPASRRTLFWGKALSFVAPAAFALVTTVFAGLTLLDSRGLALSLFLAAAPPLSALAVAVSAVAGTLPVSRGSEPTSAGLLSTAGLVLLAAPVVWTWHQLERYFRGMGPFAGEPVERVVGWILATTWILGFAIAGLGLTLAARLYASFLTPPSE